ncbi:2-oxoacid:acceptor oxidoreductase family protein [Sphingomonas bacterium]|uniref:2-oxoacid:acceptor oxidoreductase family protein n=1 Tax=Sphingomonas bacterium TaxID=1895847 RepID=UPI0015762B48|nr:2-oxoacid:acceptor oxidoreductase family protein [Sphingomonas bacterium]
MEREILFSGIGGQGVQLASKTLATAAMRSGRRVLMFGTYGGAMRGGDTDATVVIGEDSLFTPPVIDHAWAAIVMHPKGWPDVAAKLRPGGLLLVNTSVFDVPLLGYDGAIVPLAATGMAADAGMGQAGSMVALGAFTAATGIVTLGALHAVCEEVLPPYRREFADANRRALTLGYEAVAAYACPAWPALEQAA